MPQFAGHSERGLATRSCLKRPNEEARSTVCPRSDSERREGMKVIKVDQSGEIFRGIMQIEELAEMERNIAESKGNVQVEQSNLLACLALSSFQQVLC